MQKNTKIMIGVIVVIMLVGLGVAYASVSQKVNQTPISNGNQNEEPTVKPLPVGTEPGEMQTITAQHFFQNGKHTLSGKITLPTPCDSLDVKTRVAESYPEQVTVAFTKVISTNPCIQVLHAEPFKVEFMASENAVIRATLDGKAVKLNLVEVKS